MIDEDDGYKMENREKGIERRNENDEEIELNVEVKKTKKIEENRRQMMPWSTLK